MIKTNSSSLQSLLDFSNNNNQINSSADIKNIVTNKILNDPNRDLMIRFKYDTASEEDTFILHENIKRLIYKTIFKNKVMMEFDDVYQEIWKKIIKSKHTWNENKGTMVSTWIVCVANSVVNSLRSKVNRHNSRCCLYDNINYFNDNENGIEDCIENYNTIDDKIFHNFCFSDDYQYFISSLDDQEKRVFEIMMKIGKNSKHKNVRRVSYSEIYRNIDEKQSVVKKTIDNLRKKFRNVFVVKQ